MQPATVCCSQLRLSQSTHTPDLQRMAPQFEVLVADFSRGLTRACGEHGAELSGTWSPSLLITDDARARQAFPGSVLRLNDGSYHIVGLTYGVFRSNDATCLQLTPLNGGSSVRSLSAGLAQSVIWIAPGCLSTHTYQGDQSQLKQGHAAAKGIRNRDDANLAVRLRWELVNGVGSITRYTATGRMDEQLTIEETLDKTDVARVAWAAVPPTIDADDIAGRRAKTVDSAAIVGMITEAAYMEQNASEGNERAAEDAFLALPRDHASLEPYRATAEGFYTHTLAAFGIARDAQLSTEFVACLLVGLAERPDMVDLATHCLAEKVENMGAALMLLARLIAVVAEIDDSVIIDAARSVTASRTSPEDAAVLAAAVLSRLRAMDRGETPRAAAAFVSAMHAGSPMARSTPLPRHRTGAFPYNP